jgi:hypothetical protein
VKLDGTPAGERYRPQIKGFNGEHGDSIFSPPPETEH